uniref:hypothetical protein n=1 Tax=Lactococcus lactis subsp. cremoris TaxID=1359 RepID=UPI0024A66918
RFKDNITQMVVLLGGVQVLVLTLLHHVVTEVTLLNKLERIPYVNKADIYFSLDNSNSSSNLGEGQR